MTRLFSLLVLLLAAQAGPSASVATGSARPVAFAMLAAPGAAGTELVGGELRSAATLRMTGALSVGDATSLDWELPLVPDLSLDGYRQIVQSQQFVFTTPPDSSSVELDGGYLVRRFHWNSPPRHAVLRVTQVVRLVVESKLTPFRSSSPYPLTAAPGPGSAELRLPAAADPLLARLARGKRREQAVVEAVADYVATHVKYDPAGNSAGESAAWVLTRGEANCSGYANLTLALLHALGIPARARFGWVSARPLSLPTPGGARSIHWAHAGTAGALHAWIEVWFPDAGWVPLDPQAEKFFVDPRHIAFWSQPDAGPAHVGQWFASHLAGESATGAPLNAGSPEILPGDGVASRVSVSMRDSFHVALRSVQRDVRGVILFSR